MLRWTVSRPFLQLMTKVLHKQQQHCCWRRTVSWLCMSFLLESQRTGVWLVRGSVLGCAVYH